MRGKPFPFRRSKKIRCQKLERWHFGELNSKLELACWSWAGGSGEGFSEPGGGETPLVNGERRSGADMRDTKGQGVSPVRCPSLWQRNGASGGKDSSRDEVFLFFSSILIGKYQELFVSGKDRTQDTCF